MTAYKPTPLVPKLRFPEFQDDPTWLAPQLAELYGFKRTNILSRDKLNYKTGTIRNIHYGDIHTKFKPLFRVAKERVPFVNADASANGFDDDAFCEEGDIVLADASEDLEDVGKAIEVVSLDGERVVAGMHTILATRRGRVPIIGFGGQLFQTAAVRAGIKKEAQGAKVYGISANRISAVLVPVPPTAAEQQKIADCLGSLDDLIAAEGRKLEALRQHKQGLMQQLFPQEGEIVPRLRFPEFGDVWNETNLQAECRSVASGKDKIDPDGEFDLYGSTGVIGKTSCGTYDGKFLLVARVGANAGTLTVATGQFGVTDNTLVVLLKNPSKVDFVSQYLKNFGLNKLIFGSGQPLITGGQLKALRLYFPSEEEQKKIAEGLSSLDDQLDAQARKLDTLKQHKRALLQQLFPSLEGQ